ncbi:MAG: PQQ-binding-like beta-propeller repeat protein [Candidatus Aminicenantes bacterium]|nr:PQQ-binding-like beta-propeller repeat protein [Candidatus Aminicenantes bacterium]
MKKLSLLLLVCLFLSFCSFFKSKIPSYPSGVIFPLERAGEITYKGRVIDFVKDVGGGLYLSTERGLVYCLAGESREVLWKFQVSEELTSSPFLGALNIYVYDKANNLYCLSKKGSLLWKKEFKQKISTGITEFKEKIYIGTKQGIFFALSTASGEELWRFEAGKAISSTPVINDGRIIFGCDDHNLYVMTEKGILLDKIKTEDRIQPLPLVEKNFLYFGTDDHYFYCFNLAKRKKKWKRKIGGKVFCPIVVDRKRIFFLCWNNVLYCLNKKNGNILWWQIIPSRSYYCLEISGEKILVSSFSSLLLCFDIETGEKIGEYDAGQEIKSNPLWVAPYLMFNLYDNKRDEGKLVFLKKILKVSLRSSMESPQKIGAEISFTVSAVGFYRQNYEFYLREGEEEKIVQEKSERNSWSWFPEKEGDYIIGVKVVDEKESLKKEIPFVIKRD